MRPGTVRRSAVVSVEASSTSTTSNGVTFQRCVVCSARRHAMVVSTWLWAHTTTETSGADSWSNSRLHTAAPDRSLPSDGFPTSGPRRRPPADGRFEWRAQRTPAQRVRPAVRPRVATRAMLLLVALAVPGQAQEERFDPYADDAATDEAPGYVEEEPLTPEPAPADVDGALRPYGSWQDDSTYGRRWRPRAPVR